MWPLQPPDYMYFVVTVTAVAATLYRNYIF